jgi:uncharacterized repeat protein (TIGR01451 family)
LNYPGKISGQVLLDDDTNCVADGSEKGLGYWRIIAEGTDFYRAGMSRPDGSFLISVPDGDYTVRALSAGSGWELCADEVNVSIDENAQTASVDFLAQSTAHCANLIVEFSAPFLRRCFENQYTVQVRNTGPETSTGTRLVLNLDQFFEFNSASIPHTLIDASTVSFDLGILALNETITFKVFFTLSCQAELGAEHCLSGNVTADNQCIGERSYTIECQENIGSFDPNDKRTFNADGRQSDQVDKDEYIYYHIRFQNTGTDTAFNVRIVDPLSTRLDIGTFEMLSASHSFTYEITDGPTLIADFKHILLPDSTTNEPESHGYLKFRIKPLPSFDYGTTIPNKADIVFDFNEPVLTNETITSILPALGVNDQYDRIDFTVFPNPAKHILELRLAEADRGRVDAWVVYDTQGMIKTHAAYETRRGININTLPSGLYMLVLIEKGEMIGARKFVKE